MTCVECGGTTQVVDSRRIYDGKAIRRRRECDKCGVRFNTVERKA